MLGLVVVTDCFLNMLTGFRQQITMLQNHIRGLEKNVRRKMKALQREAKKNRNKGNRKPSGFAVPTNISNEWYNNLKIIQFNEDLKSKVKQTLNIIN